MKIYLNEWKTRTAKVLSKGKVKVKVAEKEVEVPNLILIALPALAGKEKELRLSISPWEKYGKTRLYIDIPEWSCRGGYAEYFEGSWRTYPRGSSLEKAIQEGIGRFLNGEYERDEEGTDEDELDEMVERDEEGTDEYLVIENPPAGEVQIVHADNYTRNRYPHWHVVYEADTYEEAEEYIEERKRSTIRYAVYFNRPAGEYMITEENDYSGNWRGSKYGHFTFQADFETYEEAEKYVEEHF